MLHKGENPKSDSPSRKLLSTAMGRIMLSHDFSLRKSDAATSRVVFSSSMAYRRRGQTRGQESEQIASQPPPPPKKNIQLISKTQGWRHKTRHDNEHQEIQTEVNQNIPKLHTQFKLNQSLLSPKGKPHPPCPHTYHVEAGNWNWTKSELTNIFIVPKG